MPVQRFAEQPDFIGRVLRDAVTRLMYELGSGLSQIRTDATPAINRALAHLDPDGTRYRRARPQGGHDQAVDGGARHENGLAGPGRGPCGARTRTGRLVVATDKGWAAFRDGLDVVLAIHDRLTALLGPDDLTELVSSLRHLVDIVDASPP